MPPQNLLTVKYNGLLLDPTPYVQQRTRFLDYGNRWGNVQEIELNGYISGVSGSGDYAARLVNNFTGQFGTLDIYDGSSGLYHWDMLNLEEISTPPNHWFQKSYVPYTVKFHRYNTTSGVIEPSNEYSFIQNEDGTVSINHKISAKGVKTSTAGALANAISFVQTLSGRNAWTPLFMNSGQGVLLSVGESINRAEAIYSLNETYKYTTGVATNNVEWFTVSVADNIDNEYRTVETSLKIQASPVIENLGSLENSSLDNTFTRLQQLGYVTGAYLSNSVNVMRDSGAQTVEIKHNFLSGNSASDVTGFFDYVVSFESDLVTPREGWKVEGHFTCKGPLDYRRQQVNAFKTSNNSNWRGYLSGLILNSPIYTAFHNGSVQASPYSILDINENTGLANFSASLQLVEGWSPASVNNPKYTLEISPPKWMFDLIPAANIEGHYVVQDLQMQSQGRMNFNVSCDTNFPIQGLAGVSGFIPQLEAIYVQTGFIVNENYNTGLFSAAYNREWLGIDKMSTGLLNTKVFGSVSSNYVRTAGFKFGY